MVTVSEKDTDGKWNYLFSTDNAPGKVCTNADEIVQGATDISYRSDADLDLKEKTRQWVKVWADCQKVYRWDDRDQIYYNKWLCDATKLEVDR
jgi:hypothetical protein